VLWACAAPNVHQEGELAQAEDNQQQAPTILPTSFRVPTPKTSSRYSQQALLEKVRVHTQSTLEQIAASGSFLDIELGIECPDGEVVKAMARFDTWSNLAKPSGQARLVTLTALDPASAGQ
jgi:hypothetical protein